MSDPVSNQPALDPYAIPLEDIDMSDPSLYETENHWVFFERLRKEAPVHYCKDSAFGPFWSVTKFDDITEVDKNDRFTLLNPRSL